MYSGMAWYFRKASRQAASLSGGIAPMSGCHSVMERPESVRRVAPPTMTVPTDRPYRLFLTALTLWLFVLYWAIVIPVDRALPGLIGRRVRTALVFTAFLAAIALVVRLDRVAPARLAAIATLPSR